ncbi:MAG: hypothetical protein HY920_05635 [Elusimicrobia bacterium]|nr:hypothetical protein [Elusimicrobiota bacterium]
MNCTKCGYQNKEEALFCDLCKEVFVKSPKVTNEVTSKHNLQNNLSINEIRNHLFTPEWIIIITILLFTLAGMYKIYFMNLSKASSPPLALKKKWIAQFGTQNNEYITGLALDAVDDLIIAGTNLMYDSYLAKYDKTGKQIYLKSYGIYQDLELDKMKLHNNERNKIGRGLEQTGDHGVLAINKISGDIVVANRSKDVRILTVTDVNNPDNYISDINVGNYDVFLSIFDSTGNKKKTVRFGTYREDMPCGIAIDKAGNIYISGNSVANAYESQIFLYKLDSLGNKLWDIHFVLSAQNEKKGNENRLKDLSGLAEDVNCGLAIDSSGNIWIAGSSTRKKVDRGPAIQVSEKPISERLKDQSNNETQTNIVVMKVSPSGQNLLRKSLPLPKNCFGKAKALVMDKKDNLYIAGEYFNFWKNGKKGFVSKINANGNQKFFKTVQANGINSCESISLDGQGNIYVTGIGNYLIEEEIAKYRRETYCAYFAKLTASGNAKWVEMFKAAKQSQGICILVNSTDEIYVCGDTTGSLEEGKTNFGGSDAFLSLWQIER